MTLARNIRAVDLESLPLDFVDRLYGVIARCYPELLADLSVIQLFMCRLGLSDDNDKHGARTSADARAADPLAFADGGHDGLFASNKGTPELTPDRQWDRVLYRIRQDR